MASSSFLLTCSIFGRIRSAVSGVMGNMNLFPLFQSLLISATLGSPKIRFLALSISLSASPLRLAISTAFSDPMSSRISSRVLISGIGLTLIWIL